MYFAHTTVIALTAAALWGCASSGRLDTTTGKPEIRVSRTWLKQLPVAIAAYNIDHGRHLDAAHRNELVTFDGIKSSDGSLEVRSKTVYDIDDVGDSVTLTSKRLVTSDLDDDGSEALDQPSLDEQQAELQQIVRRLAQQMAAETEANVPNTAGSDRSR
jgi:hypothetical protein